jgi:hypothetical protein
VLFIILNLFILLLTKVGNCRGLFSLEADVRFDAPGCSVAVTRKRSMLGSLNLARRFPCLDLVYLLYINGSYCCSIYAL